MLRTSTEERADQRRAASSPLLPTEANMVLKVVGFLFAAEGVLTLLAIGIVVISKLAGAAFVQGMVIRPVSLAVKTAIAAGLTWVGFNLQRGRRLAGAIALGLIGLQVIVVLLFAESVQWTTFVPHAVGIVAIAVSWGHLTRTGAD